MPTNTILWADQVSELQILDRHGVRHGVQPADGALLINHDAALEALLGTLAEGETGYGPITVAENIAMKVAGLRTGVAPQAVLREAARLASAAK